MKRLIIFLAIILLTVSSLQSQNRIDPKSLRDYSVDFNNTAVFVKNWNDFIIGWNYGRDGKQFDVLMNSNFYLHAWYDNATINFAQRGNNHKWYLTVVPLNAASSSNNANDQGVVGTQSIYYEPSIDVVTDDSFTPTSNHIDGAVFGFQQRHSGISSVNGLCTLTTSINSSTPVLSNVWPKNELKFWNRLRSAAPYNDGWKYGDGDLRDGFNGREWYLSINVRSTDSIIHPSVMDNPLLKLKVKYWYTHHITDSTTTRDSNYIKFDTVPGSQISDINGQLGDYRGKTRNDTTATNITRDFIITPGMLITKTNPDSALEAITLSAKFNCYYQETFDPFDSSNSFNPYLQTPNGDRNDQVLIHENYSLVIDSMDIEVYYYNSSGVGVNIDWVKLEVPKARELYRGQHDNYIRFKVNQIVANFSQPVPRDSNHRIAGFYTNDEYFPNLWAASRYFNMLVDTMSNSENDKPVTLPSQFLHATGYNSFWNGKNTASLVNQAAPYIFRGINENGIFSRSRTFGLKHGYGGNSIIQFSAEDIRNSKYETWLRYMAYENDFEITDFSVFDEVFNNSTDFYIFQYGRQYSYEHDFYHHYYKRKSLLFGEKPWISWLFMHSGNWCENPDNGTIYSANARPQTGEELRLQMFHPIALGAKGLSYWVKNSTANNTFVLNPGLNLFGKEAAPLPGSTQAILDILADYNTNLEGIISDENLGGDFIDFSEDSDDPYLWNTVVENTDVYQWGLLGIPDTRMYIGLTTQRSELHKINTWINHNRILLNDLQLIAWYGKGHAEMYSQQDGYDPNLIDNYVNRDDILTRPIGREENGMPLFEQGVIDSGMYDITILRTSQIGIDKEIYLTCINRRTDPLIYTFDTLFTYDFPSLEPLESFPYEGFRFYSTEEMERFCDEGGNVVNPTLIPGADDRFRVFEDDLNQPNTYWQSYFWKRQGCREISLKFNMIDPSKEIYYKVEEITDGTEFSEELPFWKKEEINNQVKTVIKQGEYLTLKMLPGSGRMFKVNIINDNTNLINGELAFSNQTKMVVYPAGQESNYNFWKDPSTNILNFYKDSLLYYHIVYDRKEPNNLSRVYYRRSLTPYNRDIDTKIINWGGELLISDTLVLTKQDHLSSMPPPLDSTIAIAGSQVSCRYPSIVIRYNAAESKAYTYIVFSCTNISYPDTPRVFMVECAFPHNTIQQNQIPNRLKPIAYGYTNASGNPDLEKWGGVSINASFSGNYYAWCDSIYGIGVGWKSPNDRGFITNKKHIKFGTNSVCTQPSLNTYSRMEINEEECALVFKELDGSFSQIIYTKLKNISGVIDNYIHTQICGGGNGFNNNGNFSLDQKEVMLNPPFWAYSYNSAEFPVIFRPSEFARRPGFEYADSMMFVDAKWDRVYWQGKTDFFPNGPKSIFLKNIDISEPLNCLTLLPPIRLYATTGSLAHPNPGPGAPSSNTTAGFSQLNVSDSSYILSFIKYSGTLPSYTSDIYQLNHNAWLAYIERWLAPPYDDQINMTGSLTSYGKGIYPHTAHTPVVTKNQDWFIQDRIFQTTGETIKTKAWLFLKGQQDEQVLYPMLSISDSNSNSSISEIYLLGDNINQSIRLKSFISPERGKYEPVDTIYSDWFRVDEMKELGFFSIINDSTLFKIELESKIGKVNIPVRKDLSNQLNSKKITLLNGKNNLYRIKMTKKKNSFVWMDLLMDSKRDLEDITDFTKDLKKSTIIEHKNHEVIDLGIGEISSDIELRIYPNPANEFIFVTGELLGTENQIIRYRLYNSSGIEVFTIEGLSGQPIIIPTSGLISGAYFLKAEQKIFNDIQHTITKSLMIIK